jgi:hypothetical protein
MRSGWAVLLGILGLSAGSVPRADVPAARTLISHCAETAEPGLHGLEALHDACPGIEQAIEELGVAPLLPADWRTQLSPRALGDLAALEARYADPLTWKSVEPDAHRLRSIALSLAPPPAPPSWWERLKAWIRAWLEPANGRPPAWLRFLPRFSLGPRLQFALFAALASLIVVAAAAVIVIEWKAARAGAPWRSRLLVRRSRADAASSEQVSPDVATLANLDSVPARERPVLLLRALVHVLTRAERLRRDRQLTCRELIAQARFDTARQREDFQHVALLAERALYGGPEAVPATIPDEVLRSARALYDQLLAPGPAVTGAGS